eukprot:CAMPEP_0201483968 /NCGR_PEP_ID=MMETSP0151_2-20130828/8156_1 /ASSEMBLY_ACC=CAM_ASM_000257 /TAXON_ID=200890 /ORGANISM="Paramoeba atlantica, Strain 621/1 / CCAP 1560/9" /LENGTH=412 /DNA_ID=CAMNT_0047867371 /DNA_START=67 /DNA_END=1301 /DNA_ORIENTATION=+
MLGKKNGSNGSSSSSFPFLFVLLMFFVLLICVGGEQKREEREEEEEGVFSKEKVNFVRKDLFFDSSLDSDSLIKFWTKERMEAAKPMPFPIYSSSSSSSSSSSQISSDQNTASTSSTSDEESCTGLYETNKSRSWYTNYPGRAVGKLFFFMGKTAFTCSASIVQTKYIWTAGHCLYEQATETYSSKVLFSPGYYDGNSPYGQFTANEIFVPDKWIDLSDRRARSYDYGVLGLTKDVQSAVKSSLPLVVDLSPSTTEYQSVGYPAVDPFNGKYAHICISNMCARDQTTFPDPSPVGISCDATQGSSGGPFMEEKTRIGQSPQYFLASVTSYGLEDRPDVIFGPYFNGGTASFWESILNARVPNQEIDPVKTKGTFTSKYLWIVVVLSAFAVAIGVTLIIRWAVGNSSGPRYET